MPTERRVARFRVSPKLLMEALHVPDGAQIYGAEWDFASDRLIVYVTDEKLPPVEEGGRVPDVYVNVTTFTEPAKPDRFESKWG